MKFKPLVGGFTFAAVFAVAVVLAGCGESGGDGKQGLSTLVDGNATCAEHVTPGPVGTPAGHGASIDELKFVIDPVASPQRIRTGSLKGNYRWKAPTALTAERNAFVAVDPTQIGAARLRYDPLDDDVSFDGLAKTVRFSACFASQLEPDGEKVTPMTGWVGEIITSEPKLCLRTRVISERSNEGVGLALPLGSTC